MSTSCSHSMDPRRSERIVREVAADVATVAGGRWVVTSFIGAGSYGEVCGGRDRLTGRRVAIKRVATCLQHGARKSILSDTFLAKRVLREVALLTHFKHPNILGLHAVAVPPSPSDSPPPPGVPSSDVSPLQQSANPGGFACARGDLTIAKRLFLITDLLDTDLAAVLRSGQALSEDHVSFFAFQVLLAMKALHDANVMHRDLHPANILLSLDNDVKLCDFNLCREEAATGRGAHRVEGDGDEDVEPGAEADGDAAGGAATDLTDYVTSRWYRAPELVMQWRRYDRKVDLWSLGCLIAEMYRGGPLFRGSTFYQQLDAIVHVIGRPPEESIAHIGTPAARRYLYRNPEFANIVPKDLKTLVPNASANAVDLLRKLLVFNPAERISVDQALRHPFFADLYHPADLPAPHPLFDKDAAIEALTTPEQICCALEDHANALALDDYHRLTQGIDGVGVPPVATGLAAAPASRGGPVDHSVAGVSLPDIGRSGSRVGHGMPAAGDRAEMAEG